MCRTGVGDREAGSANKEARPFTQAGEAGLPPQPERTESGATCEAEPLRVIGRPTSGAFSPSRGPWSCA